MENFYNVNDKKLYVDIIGSKENTPILYLHGAPGVGVADFTAFQKSNFEKDYYLIAPEQRGVWRSQALDDEEGYSIPKIIEDYEEIRKIFGIKKWICITQCSGARTALQYYKNYPEIFAAFVFENPIFDNMTIFNEILKLQLKLLKNKFGDIVYSEYLNDAQLVKNPLELENFCNKLGRKTDVNMNMILMSIGTAQKMETSLIMIIL